MELCPPWNAVLPYVVQNVSMMSKTVKKSRAVTEMEVGKTDLHWEHTSPSMSRWFGGTILLAGGRLVLLGSSLIGESMLVCFVMVVWHLVTIVTGTALAGGGPCQWAHVWPSSPQLSVPQSLDQRMDWLVREAVAGKLTSFILLPIESPFCRDCPLMIIFFSQTFFFLSSVLLFLTILFFYD